MACNNQHTDELRTGFVKSIENVPGNIYSLTKNHKSVYQQLLTGKISTEEANELAGIGEQIVKICAMKLSHNAQLKNATPIKFLQG